MKNTLRPFSKVAKLALSLAAGALVALGIYDEATAATLVGGAMAFGAGFWELYDARKPRV